MKSERTATAKRWRCNECSFVYNSPIPVSAVGHECKAAPIPGKRPKGMSPE